jgi:hypothetical protein
MNNNNDKETTRHTHSKTHLTQASTFISSQPKYTNTMSGIDTSHIIHQIKRNFSSYDEHSKESFQTYNNINKETSNFITSYKLILSKKEKQTEKIKDPKLRSPFTDLINQYEIKGYSIPDLSVNKNLFNPSILLNEPKKVAEFLMKVKNMKNLKETKDFNFIRKLNVIVKCKEEKFKKMNNDKKYAVFKKALGVLSSPLSKAIKTNINSNNVMRNKYNTMYKGRKRVMLRVSGNNSKQSTLTPIDVEDEINKLKVYNKSIENCLETINSYDNVINQKRSIKNMKLNHHNKIISPHTTTHKNASQHVIAFTNNTHKPFTPNHKHNNYITFKNTHINKQNKGNDNITHKNNYNYHHQRTTAYSQLYKHSRSKQIQSLSSSALQSYCSNNNNNNNSLNQNTTVNGDNVGVPRLISRNKLSLNVANTNETEPNDIVMHNRYNSEINTDTYTDPSDFFRIIQKTKQKIQTYNADRLKAIALDCKESKFKGKELVNKITTLDNKIINLDKTFIKAVEYSKL